VRAYPPSASHRGDGRTTSARMARISPTDSRSIPCRACRPQASSQPTQICFQSAPGGLSAAGQPPLLPGIAGLLRQLGQQQVHAADLPVAAAGIGEPERRVGEHGKHRIMPAADGRPLAQDGP
jgi:hypothetical protein